MSLTYIYELLALSQWNFTPFTTGLFCLAAFIVGLTKAGLPGGTIVAVPLMAMVIPPKISVGVMLPIFMVADVFSISFWHRHAQRHYCFPYLLFIGLGIVGASFVVKAIDDKTLGVIIGWLILFLITLNLFTEILRKKSKDKDLSPPPDKPPLYFSALFGILTGAVSTLANAGGPIISLYLMLSRRDKFQFLGITAVCAFFMNWGKVPVFLSAGSINANTLKLSITAIPMVALGAFMGHKIAEVIPQKVFKNVVFILAFAASLSLILR